MTGCGCEDISCMTYVIHVDILLEYVFVCVTIACALRWGVILVIDYHYWAMLTPRGTTFQVQDSYQWKRSLEAKIKKKGGL